LRSQGKEIAPESGVTQRLGGRTARNAAPVDLAIRTTHMGQGIIECVLLTGT
jgi:hypothetical protein